jgi:hypothetical protein
LFSVFDYFIDMSKNKKQNDGVRDPSPIRKQASASPSTTQASAAVKSSATALSHSSTAVVAKGTRGPDFAHAARAAPAGTPVGGTETRALSGGAGSLSSGSPHSAPRDSRAARESRALRDSDASPSGNLFTALSNDDASVSSSASSQDPHPGPMFRVGSCIFPAESIYYHSVFQKRLIESGPVQISVQSDAFADFIPSDGHELIPEAAGLQHYLPPSVPLTDFSFSGVQESTLSP